MNRKSFRRVFGYQGTSGGKTIPPQVLAIENGFLAKVFRKNFEILCSAQRILVMKKGRRQRKSASGETLLRWIQVSEQEMIHVVDGRIGETKMMRGDRHDEAEESIKQLFYL